MLDRLNFTNLSDELLPRCRARAPKGAPVAERKPKAAGGKSHLEDEDTPVANSPQANDSKI